MWLPGMKPKSKHRLKEGAVISSWISKGVDEWSYPDMKDPATLGCLLGLLRSHSRDKNTSTMFIDNKWQVLIYPEPNVVKLYPTEGEAIARAILDLPRFS